MWPLRRVATLDESLGPDVCIHHLAAQFCLAALSGQSPEARQGRASWREGLTAKARAKRQSDCHDEGTFLDAGLGRDLLSEGRDLLSDRPQEGSELTGDRRCRNRGLLAPCNEPTVAGAQPQLCLPGNGTDA